MPDYSEWLSPEKLAAEETGWADSQLYMTYAAHIALLRTKSSINRILELGCGTGWVPTQFGPDVEYVGIDKNLDALNIARTKNIELRHFVQADIRDLNTIKINCPNAQLVCSFAVLKHFSLEEFASVFSRMLSLAPLGLFSMNFSNVVRDDGIEFHHIWITMEWLAEILTANKFALIYKTTVWQGLTWEHKTGEESIFAVARY
jgi:SAM-dependent methyltransferase